MEKWMLELSWDIRGLALYWLSLSDPPAVITEGANGTATPGVMIAAHEVPGEEELPQSDWTKFRGSAALANFLSADRPDILHSAKEVCRFLARPTNLALAALKRLARYLRARPRMIF